MMSQDNRLKTFFFTVSLFAMTGVIHPQEAPKRISNPSRLFNVPMAGVLRSAEICLTGGSSFGVEGNSALVRNLSIGLGGIAEAEISSSGLTNALTGESESFAMSSFKVNLIPESLQRSRFLPNVVAQLKSSSWKSINNESGAIRAMYTDVSSVSGENLLSLGIEERFSVLLLIIGKRWGFAGFQAGAAATDIRLKNGRRWYSMVSPADSRGVYSAEIPEKQRNTWAPIGGIELRANEHTKIMVEIQSVPVFDFDVRRQDVVISDAWLGVAGIRFFIQDWLTLDAGVKYQSDDRGIADAEIRLAGNCVIPVNDLMRKAAKAMKDRSLK
jgi:hypothetical protein